MRWQLKEKEEERKRKEEEEGLAQVVAKQVSTVEVEKSNECTEGDVSGNEDENVSTLEWSEA